MKPSLKFEYKITFAYLIVGGLWILFSDKLLHSFVNDPNILTKLQTYKGWFYVIITALLFYSLLKKHLIKLRNAEQRAKENDRLKTAFLQNISHEIRTPMNGIIGFADLLNHNDLSESQKTQFLEIIIKSSSQLLNIVNDVLDFSLIESGNISTNEDTVHLNHLLDELYSSFIPLIHKEISFSISKGLSDELSIVLTDDVKIRKIFYNLLNNAIKFTEKGHIKLGYTLKNNRLEFFVEDSGIGIEENAFDKIFDRFHKTEVEANKLYEGVGLGLAISKGNVHLLNGEIWVQSEIGKGSTFFFTIAYKPETKKIINTPNTHEDNEGFDGLTVLVAEDEKSNFLYLKEILESPQFKIHHALNGKEAVEICQKNNTINMVLMDVKMPVMDGYEATKRIKKFRPEMPIIALTAYAINNEKEKALNAGCTDYIPKPFKKEHLLSTIKKHQLAN